MQAGTESNPSGYDEITGFSLRERFLRDVDEALQRAPAGALRKLWLAVVSLPTIRFVNAALGFEAGDKLLCELGATMRREIPEAFAWGRLDGDELAVASFAPPSRASRRGGALGDFKHLAETFHSLGAPIFTTLRVGVCDFRPCDDARSLVRKAQLALIKAKEGGGDLQRYTDELGRLAEQRARFVSELLQAVQGDTLTVHYQPQIDLRTGAMVGAEALVRWPTPTGSFISTSEFMPTAEHSELVIPLGEWVLRESCRQAARWRAAGLGPFHVAVNVAPTQFYKTDLVATVRTLLADLHLEPHWLELELTEQAVMTDGEESVTVLRRLRNLGIHLAIDDFGTGYSSLAYLKRFPIDRLKIDESFVRDADHDPGDAAIVRTIIAMGKNLGMKILAEGVEYAGQVKFLTTEGCDQAQGYYFSHPLDPAALQAYAQGLST